MKRLLLSLTFIFAFSVLALAQVPDFTVFLNQNFDVVMSAWIFFLPFLVAKLPFLAKINKVWITLAIIIGVGAFYMITYNVPISKIWINALISIGTYLGIGKPLVETPVIKQVETPEIAE